MSKTSPTSLPPTKRKGLFINPFAFVLSGLGDSNARPLRPERSALPTALNPETLRFASAKVHKFL